MREPQHFAMKETKQKMSTFCMIPLTLNVQKRQIYRDTEK